MKKEEMQDMMREMMSQMCAEEDSGGMKEKMSGMMQGGDDKESAMPEMMLKNMMPHCIEMMMPAIAKDKRAELVSGMVGTLVEQASSGMSDEEKRSLKAKVVESMIA